MENWQLFTDPRLQLRFKYPATTPQGHIVEKIEGQSTDSTRVHLISRDSQEVYFEVRRSQDLLPQVEYQRHRAYLEKRFKLDGFAITELTYQAVDVSSAYQYSFQWDGKRRVAILIQQDQITYRIIYDPYSPINTQILSTIVFVQDKTVTSQSTYGKLRNSFRTGNRQQLKGLGRASTCTSPGKFYPQQFILNCRISIPCAFKVNSNL